MPAKGLYVGYAQQGQEIDDYRSGSFPSSFVDLSSACVAYSCGCVCVGSGGLRRSSLIGWR